MLFLFKVYKHYCKQNSEILDSGKASSQIMYQLPADVKKVDLFCLDTGHSSYKLLQAMISWAVIS